MAQNGNSKAQKELGDMYYHTLNKWEESIEWYRLSANQGNVEAQLELINALMDSVPDNIEHFMWLRLAAKSGNAQALSDLGVFYWNNNNYKQAVKSMRLAADKGDQSAIADLSFFYNTDTMLLVADKYFYGDMVSMDVNKAIQWYQKAAILGNNDATKKLVTIYSQGQGNDVSKNIDEALKWYKLSIDQNGSSEEMIALAQMYYDGHDAEVDLNESFQWYKKAADNYNKKAMRMVGEMYFKGQGTKQNLEYALYYLLESGLDDATTEDLIKQIVSNDVKRNEQSIKSAINIYRNVCDLGSLLACFKYKELEQL